MAENLSWTFELVDKVSGPARQAEKATSDFEKELEKVRREIDKVKKNPIQFKELQHAKKELTELRSSTKSWAERFDEIGDHVRKIGFVQNAMLVAEGFNLAYEGAKLAYEVGEKVVDVAIDIGKDMLNSAAQAERFSVSFQALLGSEAGKDVLEYVEHIAKATEASDDELKAMSARLLTIGFDAKELSQVLPAALDVGAMMGGGVEKVEAAAEALAHIKTTGEISKRSIGALGLQYAQVMDKIKKETGLSDEALKTKLESGKFGPQVLHAVLQSIADKEGGQLGTTAEKMAATVSSKLKKLKELPDQFFQGLVKAEGFSKFEDFLTKLVEELSPESEFGQEVTRNLTGLFNDVFGSISDSGGDMTSVIKEGILATIDGARDLVPVVQEVAGFMLDILEDVAEAIRAFRILHAVQSGNMDEAARIYKSELERQQSKEDRRQAKAAKAAGFGTGERGVLANAEAGTGSVLRDMPKGDEISTIAPIGTGSVLRNIGAGSVLRAAGGAEEPIPQYAYNPGVPSQSSRAVAGSGARHQTAHVHPGAIQINVPPGANTDEIAGAVGQALPGAAQQAFERMATSSGAL